LATCLEQAIHDKPDSSEHEVQRSKADGGASFAKNHCTLVSKKKKNMINLVLLTHH
jgi:hypothetical protein